MHETYSCPPGGSETIYKNFRPFGFVNTAYEVDNELGEKQVIKAEILGEGSQDTESNMRGRMAGMTKSG